VPTNNRSQLTETPFNQLVVDAYNANPTSMMAAIENFRLMEVPHKIVLLGDMKELGEGSREEHRKVVEHLRQCDFERIVLVGPEFAEVHAEFEHYPDMESLKNVLSENRPEGCYILIKGSNSMKMHRLVDVL
jgi:UDP-N-acetylmuramoyl-tripeptide--D-alanyl-D-alanine ligase